MTAWTRDKFNGIVSKDNWTIVSTPRGGVVVRYRGHTVNHVRTIVEGKDYCDNSGYARTAAAQIDATLAAKGA